MIAPTVQAHPLRAEMAEELAELVPGCTVTLDPDPDGFPSPWRTYRLCLETTPVDADHRMILQEDVILCPWFWEAANLAVDAHPDRIIAFFVGGRPDDHGRQIRRARQQGRVWAELLFDRWCPTVALVWPVRHIIPFLEFVDAQDWPRGMRADDEIVGHYLRNVRERMIASAPSLVEHPDMVRSILGHNRARQGADHGRVAAWYIDESVDARELDWAQEPLGHDRLPYPQVAVLKPAPPGTRRR